MPCRSLRCISENDTSETWRTPWHGPLRAACRDRRTCSTGSGSGCPREAWTPATPSRPATAARVAALKCVYMTLMSLDPTGKGRKRWTMRWKAPLNAFQIAFEGRLTPANN
ncbi:hypothetical protein CGZ69_35845 [Streptomyces peucetius subsp. caesius ATCC 27952]|nr:hypothetical protein CGZ69_35845 [Streptomyces peucetius subsp. caesius ATCC 27952]